VEASIDSVIGARTSVEKRVYDTTDRDCYFGNASGHHFNEMVFWRFPLLILGPFRAIKYEQSFGLEWIR